MDNLTHSLVGATLGRIGLKRLTGRAMPVLIVSANLPDIDSFVAPLFGIDSLVFHRGFTHGIGGWVLMPFIATALVLAWNRWRPANEPVRFWPLLLLAVIGTLSHPLLDLMNTYGVRLLEPFSDRWFYADTLFIADPWIWIALIVGLELSWRAERIGRHWTHPASVAGVAVLAYIGLNLAISAHAETLAKQALRRVGRTPQMVVASPQPILSWQRQMLWRDASVAGSGWYDPLAGVEDIRIDRLTQPLNLDDPRLAPTLAHSKDAAALWFWSRMPLVVEEDGRAYLADQRFLRHARSSFRVPLDSGPANP